MPNLIRFLLLLIITTSFSMLFTANGGVVVLHIIGDSTAESQPASIFPLMGWGQKLDSFIDPARFRIDDAARSGESSKSFYDSGLWSPVYNTLKPGDFVLIQFGHNDEKPEEYRHTDPYTTYKDYLKHYVIDARVKGAIPVLCTPIPKSIWLGNVVTNSHGDYPDAVKQLATEMDVPFLDLGYKTKIMMESMGEDSMNTIFTILEPRQYPNWPNGANDHIHLQENGAIKVAKFAIEGLQELGLITDISQGIIPLAVNDISIYPNPCGDYVELRTGGLGQNVKVDVYNISGMKIKTIQASGQSGMSVLDMSGLPRGIYLIRAHSNGHVYTEKLIRQ